MLKFMHNHPLATASFKESINILWKLFKKCATFSVRTKDTYLVPF